MCTCVSGAHRGRKRVSGPWNGIGVGASHRMGTGARDWALHQSSSAALRLQPQVLFLRRSRSQAFEAPSTLHPRLPLCGICWAHVIHEGSLTTPQSGLCPTCHGLMNCAWVTLAQSPTEALCTLRHLPACHSAVRC